MDYVRWGEDQEYHTRSTVQGRVEWWWLSESSPPPLIMNKRVNDRHFVTRNAAAALCHQALYEIRPKKDCDPEALAAALNSAVAALFAELTAPRSLGEGVLELAVRDADALLVPDPRLFGDKADWHAMVDGISSGAIGTVFTELSLENDSRAALDAAVLEVMNMPPEFLAKLYDRVKTLVSDRLTKANSV
jgi:hypothetical protein